MAITDGNTQYMYKYTPLELRASDLSEVDRQLITSDFRRMALISLPDKLILEAFQ